MLDSPLFAILAYGTSIIFTTIAAMVPPNAGNFVMGLFASSMASFLGGEDDADDYELEIEDADV